MNLVHPDFSKLASRIEVSNLHKETDDDYMKVIEKLNNMTDKLNSKDKLEMKKEIVLKIE